MHEIQIFCYSPQCDCENIFNNYKNNSNLISAYLFDKTESDEEPHLYLNFNDTTNVTPIAEEIREKKGVKEVRYTRDSILLTNV